jgi:hypothetical protein
MPEPIARTAWAETGTIEGAAALFGVSTEAMQWRLFNCGLVADPRPAGGQGDE